MQAAEHVRHVATFYEDHARSIEDDHRVVCADFDLRLVPSGNRSSGTSIHKFLVTCIWSTVVQAEMVAAWYAG